MRTITSLLLAVLLSTLPTGLLAEPLKGLLLTSPGIYHDYAYQTEAISSTLAERVNIRFDISLRELERWRSTDFARGYDVVIYNICEADNTDADLIANLRKQTEVHGVPAMVLHCTMHSFRNTDSWWPLYGLKSVAHEAIGPIQQQVTSGHPITADIPADWQVVYDELYINLAFDAQALLTAQGEDGEPHVTAWIKQADDTRIFGTTLGHSLETIDDPIYQRLLGNALLWVTDNLNDDGQLPADLTPVSGAQPIANLSKADGIDYFTDDIRDCMQWQMGKAVGPCYLGCVLNPTVWGAEAQACKEQCFAGLPDNDSLAAACAEN